MGSAVRLVDSAEETASEVEQVLKKQASWAKDRQGRS